MAVVEAASIRYPLGIREQELTDKVAADFFGTFDCTRKIGNIDFCVAAPATQLKMLEAESILWAEAKKGNKASMVESFIQLILTLGKEKPFDKYLPPKFLGAFDAEKIAFIPYHEVMDIFEKNDFNWNVPPSDHDTKEFKELDSLIGEKLVDAITTFSWSGDEKELRAFIKSSFKIGEAGVSRIQITKNNFTHIYSKWRETVMPTIDIPDWNLAKKNGIIDADFFLADILSQGNVSLSRKLNILLKLDHYKQELGVSNIGLPLFQDIRFKDGQKAHHQFWNRYKRPPREEYREYIINRRDLLVPQDVRERKGSFFTPKKWVELSQHYLELELGENWQDEYYVWDCCAGTGNLLAGLTNKHKVWASTLDFQDVAVMKQRIANGANLIGAHVFQFDFLNDPLDSEKIPEDLRDVLRDEEKRKRLVIYINPPYAEHANRRMIVGTGTHRPRLAKDNKTYLDFEPIVGTATRELYIQFFLRIYRDLYGAVLASFSTMKFVCSQNCAKFRTYWRAKYLRGFICPADTFDNVSGVFPIAFTMWNLNADKEVTFIVTNVIDKSAQLRGNKEFHSSIANHMISDWLRSFYGQKNESTIAYLALPGVSMQQRSGVYITSKPTESDVKQHKVAAITQNNLMPFVVYLAVRHCIMPTWINNKDEFRLPHDSWEADFDFQGDCLVWALFDNVIKSKDGVNHWIPFTEKEVNANGLFKSHFMSDFLAGKIEVKDDAQGDLFAESAATERKAFVFSPEAQAVMDAGRELWRYYHSQPRANPNASFYDIRLHFQGSSKDAKGKERMNSESSDATYTALLAALRTAMKTLARRIEPKVYEYGFLKR